MLDETPAAAANSTIETEPSADTKKEKSKNEVEVEEKQETSRAGMNYIKCIERKNSEQEMPVTPVEAENKPEASQVGIGYIKSRSGNRNRNNLEQNRSTTPMDAGKEHDALSPVGMEYMKCIEKNNTDQQKPVAPVEVGNKAETPSLVGSGYIKCIEKNNIEPGKSTTPPEAVDKQEASQARSIEETNGKQQRPMQPVEVDAKRETPQDEAKPKKGIWRDSAPSALHTEEEEKVQIDDNDDRNASVHLTAAMIEETLKKEYAETRIKEETPATSSSDSESDCNTNIFSAIGTSVSFSEDETTQQDCSLNLLEISGGDTIVSTKSDTSLLVFHDDYDDDDITVPISNVSPECRRSATKRAQQKRKYRHEYNREQTSSFEIETATLQNILVQLPDDEHRAILSQLMIMTNARDKASRINIAFQVQDSLVTLIETHRINADPGKAVQLIFHLARLKKSYRVIFGKSLFKAMSKLYKRSEKLKEKNGSSSSKKEKKVST